MVSNFELPVCVFQVQGKNRSAPICRSTRPTVRGFLFLMPLRPVSCWLTPQGRSWARPRYSHRISDASSSIGTQASPRPSFVILRGFFGVGGVAGFRWSGARGTRGEGFGERGGGGGGSAAGSFSCGGIASAVGRPAQGRCPGSTRSTQRL